MPSVATKLASWISVFSVWVPNKVITMKLDILQWRHNERDGVTNHQRIHCLFNRLFRRRSKKTSKLRVTGFCEGNSPVIGEFPTQRASRPNAENYSSWWRHHAWFLQPFLAMVNFVVVFADQSTWSKWPPKCRGTPSVKFHHFICSCAIVNVLVWFPCKYGFRSDKSSFHNSSPSCAAYMRRCTWSVLV